MVSAARPAHGSNWDHRNWSVVGRLARTLDLRNGVYDGSFPLGRHVPGAEREVDQMCQRSRVDRSRQAKKPCGETIISIRRMVKMIERVEHIKLYSFIAKFCCHCITPQPGISSRNRLIEDNKQLNRKRWGKLTANFL